MERSLTVHRFAGITGVILAGGASSRMGSNKALLPCNGGRFIEAIHRQLAELFTDVIVVTNAPEQYQFLPCRKVPDLCPGMGALAGIHSGLWHSTTPHIFAVACDMPYLDSGIIRYMAAKAIEDGVVIPETARGTEPLHAIYGRGCLAAMDEALRAGEKRVVSFFGGVRVIKVTSAEIALFDSQGRSFLNINTPADYFLLRKREKEETGRRLDGAGRSARPGLSVRRPFS